MSKRADFLLALQTYMLLKREAPSTGIVVLRGAFAFPEHALPDDVAGAAFEYARYVDGHPKPKWLLEHEENEQSGWSTISERGPDRLIELAREWWNNVAATADASHVPPTLRAFIQGDVSKVRVPKTDALAFLDWASTIPGFDFDDPPFDVVHDDAA